MSRMKNILAATDLSSPARQAAERAARLARSSGARLRLVHVLDTGVMAQWRQLAGQRSRLEAKLVEQTRLELQTLADDLAAERGAIVDAALLHGTVPEQIVVAADTLPADLVVLGARGGDFLRHFVPGSTAERLVRKATQPMLVVKQRAHEPYRRVLVAVDFSPWSEPLVALARSVAPRAHLMLLSAYEVPFEGKLRYAGVAESTIHAYREQMRLEIARQLQALAARTGLEPADWSPYVPRADPSLAIVEHEQDVACDLIVMGKHGRHIVEELLLGSVTSHVLAESAGDVLVSTSTVA